MRYWRKVSLFGRNPGRDRFGTGSVYFDCHKHPEIQVTFLDCQRCPFGNYYKDWEGTGWEECWFKREKDLQQLKELKQKEEREKREFQEFLRQNAEENERLRQRQEEELREYEPKRQKILREVEEAMREPHKVSLWPAKEDQIDWDWVLGTVQDEDEEEPSDEDNADGEE